MPKKPRKVAKPRSRAIDKLWALFKANPIAVGATLFGVFVGIPAAVTVWDSYIYPVLPALNFQVEREVTRLEKHIRKLESSKLSDNQIPGASPEK